MNANKAREFFSSYFEGTLDAGLQQAFERRLHTDAEIQAEYRAFERTMNQLSSLKDLEVEVPFDLHEKISARVDHHIFEEKRSRVTPWMTFLKPLAIGALATAAILGAILALNNRGGGKVNEATSFGTSHSVMPEPKVEATTGFKFQIEVAETERQVTASNAMTGSQITGFEVGAGEDSSINLTNSGPAATLTKIEISGDKLVRYIAVPTSSPRGEDPAAKDDTLRGAALRLAQQYKRPIVLIANDPLETLPITATKAVDPVAGVREIFGPGFAVEVRNDDFIRVQEH